MSVIGDDDRPTRAIGDPKVGVGQPSDAELVTGIARRDHDAFAEVYSRYRASVGGAARRVCGDHHAEEVVQDVFLRLWNQPDRFNAARGSLRTYLVMQANGRAIDLARRDSARQARESADHTRSPRTIADVEATAMGTQDDTELRRLLSTLPDAERDAIALAFFGGHTYNQVASLLDQPEGTVKGRIRSGLRRLNLALSGDSSDLHSRA